MAKMVETAVLQTQSQSQGSSTWLHAVENLRTYPCPLDNLLSSKEEPVCCLHCFCFPPNLEAVGLTFLTLGAPKVRVLVFKNPQCLTLICQSCWQGGSPAVSLLYSFIKD